MNEPAHILVVDDEPVIREAFAEHLRRQGYTVSSAATGQEGLALARQLRPALVLLDVMLPDARGTEVCRQIKADASLQDVFVVLISGQAISPDERVEGLEVGADEYLTKPIDGHELRARIRTCLRLRDATAALRRSEATLRVFLEALPESAALLSCDGSFLLANRRLAQRLGKTTDGIIGENVTNLFPSDLVRTRQAHFEEVVRTGQLRQFEDSRDGRHYLNHLNPVLDGAGAVAQVAVLALDITQRRQLERQQACFAKLGFCLSAASRREQAADIIIDIASELFPTDAGFVNFYSPEGDSINPVLAFDTVAGQRVNVPKESLPTRPTALTRLVLREAPTLEPEGGRVVTSETAALRRRATPLGFSYVRSHPEW